MHGMGRQFDTNALLQVLPSTQANLDLAANLIGNSGQVIVLGHHNLNRTSAPLVYMDELKVWDVASTPNSCSNRIWH